MRAAVIQDGVVQNIIEVQSLDFMPGLVAATDAADIGDRWDGSAFSKPEPVVKVPEVVTMKQARLALLAAGKLADVDTAISAMPATDSQAARIQWEYSAIVERRSSLVASLGSAIGLNDAQIDALFIQAQSL